MSRESLRWVDGDRARATMDLTREQTNLLEQVRARVGNPALSWAEAFEIAAKFYLAKTDPGRRVRNEEASPVGEVEKSVATSAIKSASPALTDEPPPEVIPPATRHIPAATRREVWRRDGGKCTFRSPISGKVCGSAGDLQLDHLREWAFGGGHDADNLALRCGAHNRWRVGKACG